MALFTKTSLRRAYAEETRYKQATNAKAVLESFSNSYSPHREYDIFLSHSFLDAELIYGLKLKLEQQGFSVYIYWVEDPQKRDTVNRETAERLRSRMRSCKSLLYATSENASNSKWMPWELGYFDGIKGTVAIAPITEDTSYFFYGFKGQEYLTLYPYISAADGGGDELNVWSPERNVLGTLKSWSK